MSEEAKVILSAVDEVSAPALKASASLKAYQGSVVSLNSAVQTTYSGVPKYLDGMDKVAVSASKVTISNGAAHKALNLVSGGLADIAGASPAAEAGVKVMDSALFHMATTGGAVSGGFLAIIAVAAGVGVALRNSAEKAKANSEEMENLSKSTIAAVKNLEYLDRVQKSVAGVGAAQAGRSVESYREEIDKLTESMRLNAAASVRGQSRSFGGVMSSLANEFTGGMVGTSGRDQSNQEQVKMAGQIRVLAEAMKVAQREQDALTAKSGKYVSTVALSGNPLRTFSNEMERQASQAEQLGQIIGGMEFDYAKLSAGAAKAGLSVNEAAQIMMTQNKAVQAGVLNLASAFGQTLGNAIMKGKDAWRDGLKMMLGAVFDAATGVVIAAAIMNKALTAAWIPGTFVGILAMVAALQATKAIAMASLSSSRDSAAAGGAAALSGGATGSAGGISAGGGEAGGGGRAISSASKEVVNNITVNLPVSAMDLSSVSDIQMKTLATKIGRILADAAGQGQFSLVGA